MHTSSLDLLLEYFVLPCEAPGAGFEAPKNTTTEKVKLASLTCAYGFAAREREKRQGQERQARLRGQG
jgi:hypothetical protein